MAVTSTPKITSLAKQITADFPHITFAQGTDFRWAPTEQTIYHPKIQTTDHLRQLLHEVGHALLGHATYPSDVELLNMEREAWRHAAQTLAPRYGVTLDMESEIVRESLDSYSYWLSARSTCPHCQAIGTAQGDNSYRCLVCQQVWRVNDARTCQLRRYKK